MHFHKYFEEPDITNAEKTWQGISELINRQKKKQKAIFALKWPRSNKLLNDPTEFPNIFNNFFLVSLRNLPKQRFKKKIRDCLLQILSQTNDYPDLPTLLGHMQQIQNRP